MRSSEDLSDASGGGSEDDDENPRKSKRDLDKSCKKERGVKKESGGGESDPDSDNENWDTRSSKTARSKAPTKLETPKKRRRR
eukprot:7215409-Alexandrium_andersonii.AAC.1